MLGCDGGDPEAPWRVACRRLRTVRHAASQSTAACIVTGKSDRVSRELVVVPCVVPMVEAHSMHARPDRPEGNPHRCLHAQLACARFSDFALALLALACLASASR